MESITVNDGTSAYLDSELVSPFSVEQLNDFLDKEAYSDKRTDISDKEVYSDKRTDISDKEVDSNKRTEFSDKDVYSDEITDYSDKEVHVDKSMEFGDKEVHNGKRTNTPEVKTLENVTQTISNPLDQLNSLKNNPSVHTTNYNIINGPIESKYSLENSLPTTANTSPITDYLNNFLNKEVHIGTSTETPEVTEFENITQSISSPFDQLDSMKNNPLVETTNYNIVNEPIESKSSSENTLPTNEEREKQMNAYLSYLLDEEYYGEERTDFSDKELLIDESTELADKEINIDESTGFLEKEIHNAKSTKIPEEATFESITQTISSPSDQLDPLENNPLVYTEMTNYNINNDSLELKNSSGNTLQILTNQESVIQTNMVKSVTSLSEKESLFENFEPSRGNLFPSNDIKTTYKTITSEVITDQSNATISDTGLGLANIESASKNSTTRNLLTNDQKIISINNSELDSGPIQIKSVSKNSILTAKRSSSNVKHSLTNTKTFLKKSVIQMNRVNCDVRPRDQSYVAIPSVIHLEKRNTHTVIFRNIDDTNRCLKKVKPLTGIHWPNSKTHFMSGASISSFVSPLPILTNNGPPLETDRIQTKTSASSTTHLYSGANISPYVSPLPIMSNNRSPLETDRIQTETSASLKTHLYSGANISPYVSPLPIMSNNRSPLETDRIQTETSASSKTHLYSGVISPFACPPPVMCNNEPPIETNRIQTKTSAYLTTHIQSGAIISPFVSPLPILGNNGPPLETDRIQTKTVVSSKPHLQSGTIISSFVSPLPIIRNITLPLETDHIRTKTSASSKTKTSAYLTTDIQSGANISPFVNPLLILSNNGPPLETDRIQTETSASSKTHFHSGVISPLACPPSVMSNNEPPIESNRIRTKTSASSKTKTSASSKTKTSASSKTKTSASSKTKTSASSKTQIQSGTIISPFVSPLPIMCNNRPSLETDRIQTKASASSKTHLQSGAIISSFVSPLSINKKSYKKLKNISGSEKQISTVNKKMTGAPIKLSRYREDKSFLISPSTSSGKPSNKPHIKEKVTVCTKKHRKKELKVYPHSMSETKICSNKDTVPTATAYKESLAKKQSPARVVKPSLVTAIKNLITNTQLQRTKKRAKRPDSTKRYTSMKANIFNERLLTSPEVQSSVKVSNKPSNSVETIISHFPEPINQVGRSTKCRVSQTSISSGKIVVPTSTHKTNKISTETPLMNETCELSSQISTSPEVCLSISNIRENRDALVSPVPNHVGKTPAKRSANDSNEEINVKKSKSRSSEPSSNVSFQNTVTIDSLLSNKNDQMQSKKIGDKEAPFVCRITPRAFVFRVERRKISENRNGKIVETVTVTEENVPIEVQTKDMNQSVSTTSNTVISQTTTVAMPANRSNVVNIPSSGVTGREDACETSAMPPENTSRNSSSMEENSFKGFVDSSREVSSTKNFSRKRQKQNKSRRRGTSNCSSFKNRLSSVLTKKSPSTVTSNINTNEVTNVEMRDTNKTKNPSRTKTPSSSRVIFKTPDAWVDRGWMHDYARNTPNDNSTPFICDACHRTVPNQTMLEVHRLFHRTLDIRLGSEELQQAPYRCFECHKTFETSVDHNIHVLFHEKRPYICTYCRFEFWDIPQIGWSTDPENNILCQKCGPLLEDTARPMSAREARYMHRSSKYGNVGEIVMTCENCHRVFDNYYLFRRHLSEHFIEVLYCRICEKVFESIKSFMNHARVHELRKVSFNSQSRHVIHN